MPETFPALVADLLRGDAARPLVTFYDETTGERAELSVATWANWVAKTSSLLVEELDLERGDTLLVDLPVHWLGPVFLGAGWNVGLEVHLGGRPDPAPAAVVCGPDGLSRYAADAADRPVLASALLPLGVRFPDPLPAGVHDFGVEVWSQPDSFLPWDPPAGDDPATPGVTQRELLAAPEGMDALTHRTGFAPGARLLSAANPATAEGLATFLGPLVSGGSTVWVAHPSADADRWRHLAEVERVTAGAQPIRS